MTDPNALLPEPLAPGAASVPLADVDVAWLRMDEPANRMHVHGVMVLDGDVPGETVARRLEERFAAIPRFRQRVALARGRYVWTDDPGFEIERHVVEERLDAPGGDAELARAIESRLPEPLDRRRPLWEFRVLRGYRGGDTALFGRLHHAIGDGVALMGAMLAMTDPEPGAAGGALEPNPFHEMFAARSARALERAVDEAERTLPELVRLMRAPAEAYGRISPLIRRAASVAAAARLLATRNEPATRFKGGLAVAKRVAWTEPLALDEVKRVGRNLGGTVNEVLSSTMAGALRRYLGRDGAPPETLAIRCATPVNLRPLADMAALGNRFGLLFLPLPIGIVDPLRRLEQVRRRSEALKKSAQPLMVFSLLGWAGRLPTAGQNLLIRIFGAKATAVFTNVPGPRWPMHFAGHEVRDFFFWVPQAGRLGLGLSILSYRGEVRLGIATDARLVPDPERIVEAFYAEWETLLASA